MVDEFRMNFFDKMIEEEEKLAKEEREKQAKCFHHYNLILMTHPNGYQTRGCSKCDHVAMKRITVWEGSKGCVLS